MKAAMGGGGRGMIVVRKEEDIIIPKIDVAVEIIKSYTTIGIERTMNFFNNK